jgi:hypothetical protein
MKMKGIYILICFALFTANAMAYNWATGGFTVVNTGTEAEENFLILKDAKGVSVKIRYQGELSDTWSEKIVELNKKFGEWKYMKPESMEYLVAGSSVEILILPSVFKYSDTDFVRFIPGGMTFIYDYALRYNFRVTRNDIFLRLNDKFIDEESFCKRMKEAVDDPIAYLKKRDPEYFLQKLNELEEGMAALKSGQDRLAKSVLYFQNTGFLGFSNTPVKSNVIKRVIELKTADPAVNSSKLKEQLEKEKIETSEKEIKLILNVFYNEFN